MSLKSLLFKNKKSLIIYVLGALLTTVGSPFMTLSLGYAFKILETNSVPQMVQIGIGALLLGLIPVFFQLISRFMRIGLMRDVLVDVRVLAYEKIMRQHGETFKSQSKDYYLSRMIGDINMFEKDFFLAFLQLIYLGGSFFINSLILAYFSWEIMLMAWGAAVVLMAITKVFEGPVRKAREATRAANDAYYTEISNTIGGKETIKLYRVESAFLKKFNQSIQALEQIKSKLFGLNGLQLSLSQGWNFMIQMSVYIVAAILIAIGRIDLSILIILVNVVANMVWGMTFGFRFINVFKASVDIYNILVMDEPLPEGSERLTHDTGIHVSNLSYAYDETPVLMNMNLSIKPQETLLVHGKSGTGKTTFIDCLTQNVTGYEGAITYDAHEVQTIEKASYLNRVGYIRQSHFMFDDSIRNNIILDQAYNQEKFNRVLEMAALNSWIEALPLKDETILEKNGSNISGGQKQRISIARELYRDAEILFVDEPSASLDDENAKIIYDTLLNTNRTVLIVSHRHLDYLSSHVDHVLDMEAWREAHV